VSTSDKYSSYELSPWTQSTGNFPKLSRGELSIAVDGEIARAWMRVIAIAQNLLSKLAAIPNSECIARYRLICNNHHYNSCGLDRDFDESFSGDSYNSCFVNIEKTRDITVINSGQKG
jgi:hypothetical protein